MKRLFILLFLSTALPWLTSAKQVEESIAGKVAGNFFASRIDKNQLNVLSAPVLVYTSFDLQTAQGSVTKAAPAFYVFNFTSPRGFVIVAGDDAVTPVLGYSSESMFTTDNLPPGLSWLLQSYADQIGDVVARQLTVNTAIEAEWTGMLSPAPIGSNADGGGVTVGPLLTLKWDQSPFYNDLCPFDVQANKRTPTGCVATSMAMVMKYHNHPLKGKGSRSFTHPKYGLLSADFGNTDYAWSSMPDSVGAANTAVATLMYHCGVSMDINYGPEETSGQTHANGDTSAPCTENSLKKYFRYDPSLKGVYSNDYSDADWIIALKKDLDGNLPIIYGGGNGNGKSHSYICDGYNADGRFHFNWGWGGSKNGWFLLSAVKSTGEKLIVGHDAILGVRKSTVGIYDEEGTGMLTVYPNPAKNEIFINGTDGSLVISEYILSTPDGRQLMRMASPQQHETHRIPVSNLPGGLYILTVVTKNGPLTRKVIIMN